MGKKVLLVDDSVTVLLWEKMILKNKGYELLTASNGEEAVQRAIADRPDIIFLDVVMPVMDGLEACRRLRAHEATRDTPIIIVTTQGEEAAVEEGKAAGCTEYMTKPFNRVEFLERLRHYVG